MSGLLGDALADVERAMRFRVERQGRLASNLANADTPGYRRVDLEFDAVLARAGHVLRTSHPSHLGEPAQAAGWREVVERRTSRVDGNGVNTDRELVRISRNAGAFNKQAEVMSRLIDLRRTAITGGRS
ncbi:MAG: flagellar basal body rod protein FlgB [Myxococcota bacterium]|nr:flagellar basal body rod protein FlgB [Myxococcota bacterium]